MQARRLRLAVQLDRADRGEAHEVEAGCIHGLLAREDLARSANSEIGQTKMSRLGSRLDTLLAAQNQMD
jgi:hypothetical protein